MAFDTQVEGVVSRGGVLSANPGSVPLAVASRRGPGFQWWKVPVFVALVLGALAVIFPFVWMLATSLKPEPEVITYPPHLFPRQWTLQSYVGIWPAIGFARLAVNSVVFAGGVTALSLFLDSMTAYALARLRFPGREVLFWLVLATLMVPFQVLLIPIYVTVFNLGWLNTLQGLIIPRATNGFGIFMLRQFFSGLPREFDEAARLDGANEWFIYRHITLPLSIPALMTLGIFHFTFNWNDFLWPLVITSSADMRTIPAGLALFTGEHEVQYSLLMAGAVLTMLPLLVAFVFLQRYFVRGISLSGFK
jgi:multiple sugar transport system permease protein